MYLKLLCLSLCVSFFSLFFSNSAVAPSARKKQTESSWEICTLAVGILKEARGGNEEEISDYLRATRLLSLIYF